MKTLPYTPGPYRVAADDDALIVTGASGLHIARASVRGLGKAGPANARLLAAAPDLLIALQRWERFASDNLWTDADIDFLRQTRAAIAAALGEPAATEGTR